jgi:EAL domain-containing protein (putative c-di-GMP-specific phosphodiesterase class I)
MEKKSCLPTLMIKPSNNQGKSKLTENLEFEDYLELRNLVIDVFYSVLKTENVKTTFLRKLYLVNSLEEALENKEFEVYYQPQINLNTGEIIGAEALLRWNHPEFGFISPDEFIPLAEESGLIIKIGEWVLREACNQAKIWSNICPVPLKIAVNLSPYQISQPGLTEQINNILKELHFPPQLLTLELTENALIKDEIRAQKTIEQLKRLGITLAIDDFGTGYSSLSYLQKFPFDVLKIDKSFISNLTDNPQKIAIVSGIIAIAQALNLELIAEGLEGQAELEFLTQKSCNFGQGYLFSRPVTASKFEELIKNQNYAKCWQKL